MCDKRIIFFNYGMHGVDTEYSKRSTLIDQEGIAINQLALALALANNRIQFNAKRQHQLASAHM